MSDTASPAAAAQRAAGVGAARRAPPKRRPAPAGGASRAAQGKRRAPASFPAAYRWVRVLLLVATVVVGLPLAHAMFGEVVALLGGACLLGFLLGRWTAPGG